MPADSNYAGYSLRSRLPAASAAVELWSAQGPDGDAEVFLGPEMLVRRARALPSWGPFPRVLTGSRQGRWFVVVPGRINQDLEALRDRLTGGTCLAFAWHIAAALAEVHEQGRAHGALHGGHVGLDHRGLLTIRPALASAVHSDPDPDATAQATDCLQLGGLLDLLDLERAEDRSIDLLMAGLRRERARLRMQPGRGVRQAIAAILARHPEWVDRLVEEFGPSWHTDHAPRAPYVPGAAAQPHGAPWSTAATVAAPTGSLSSDRYQTGEIEPAVVHLGAVVAGRSVGGIAPAAAPVSPSAAASPKPSPRSVLTLSLRPPDARQATDAPEPPPRGALVADLPDPAEDAADEIPALSVPEAAGPEAATDHPTDATAPAADGDPPEAIADIDQKADTEPVIAEVEAEEEAEADAEEEAAGPEPEQVLPDAGQVVDDDDDDDEGDQPAESDKVDEDEEADDDDDSDPPADDAPTPPARSALATVRPSIEPVAAPPAPAAAARLAPRSAPAATSDDPAPARVALHSPDGAPKWAGAVGVTGNASRESELGSGKWADDAANPREARQVVTNDAPVREIEMEPSGPNWGMLAAGAIVVMILVAWALFANMGGGEAGVGVATTGAPADAPASRPARVEIRLPGGSGTVSLDGRSYGAAPALVPVPTDAAPHTLCVHAEGAEPRCREVDAPTLTAGPAYDFGPE